MRGAYGAKGSHDPSAGAERGGHGPRVRAGRKMTLELSTSRPALRRARNRLGRHRLERSNELENKANFCRHRSRFGALDGTERHAGAGALLRRLRVRLSAVIPAVPGLLSPVSAAAATAAGAGRAAAGLLRAAAGGVSGAGRVPGAGRLSRAGGLSRILPVSPA